MLGTIGNAHPIDTSEASYTGKHRKPNGWRLIWKSNLMKCWQRARVPDMFESFPNSARFPGGPFFVRGSCYVPASTKGPSMAEPYQVEIETLLPYAMNTREHSDAQVDQIAASIKEFGFNAPILLESDGVTIIAGHGRLMAAKRLGLDTVPAVKLDHLTQAQARAYRIADNAIALNSEWDTEAMSAELARIAEEGEVELELLGVDADTIAIAQALEVELPELPTGEKDPFQQMTFMFSAEQADRVKQAIRIAASMGPYKDAGNDNKNANGLARVCDEFMGKTDAVS